MYLFHSNRTLKCWILVTAFVFACHSVPTDSNSMLDKINTVSDLFPTTLAWRQSDIPEELIGNWYKDGNLEISVYEDSVRVYNRTLELEDFETANPYARIIYRDGDYYKSLYFTAMSPDSVQAAYVDSAVSSSDMARSLPVQNRWIVFTSTNPWLSVTMPGDLKGNWHIYDGLSEIGIAEGSVTLDGDSWSVDSSQTNRSIFRLILHRETEYKTLYYDEIEDLKMKARLVDGTPDLQDKFGRFNTGWQTYTRWWDFLDKVNLSSGAHWSYKFSLKSFFAELINSKTPVDSFYREQSQQGRVDLEVIRNDLSDTGGAITLTSTFNIEKETNKDRQLRVEFGTAQMLFDSVWYWKTTHSGTQLSKEKFFSLAGAFRKIPGSTSGS